jgi:hypothetical protein
MYCGIRNAISQLKQLKHFFRERLLAGWICQFLLLGTSIFATNSDTIMTKVYLFPGQGSDYRSFQSLRIDNEDETISINYPVPEKEMCMREYAFMLASQIDIAGFYMMVLTHSNEIST